MIKPILNGSELSIFNEIKSSIYKNNINVFAQQSMRSIIESANLGLTGKERETFKNATFDFVITDSRSKALFVIEFDGPEHQREKNKLSDFRKVLICNKANLPILRIGYDLYDDLSKDALIEFIIFRYLKWIEEKELFIEDFNRSLQDWQKIGKTEEEIIDLVSVSEPEMEFNFKYYFPGIYITERRLCFEYNIYPEVFESDKSGQYKSKYTQIKGFGYDIIDGKAKSVVSYKINAECEKEGDIISIEKELKEEEVTIQWLYNFSEITGYREYSTKMDYHQSYSTGLPGLNITDLSLMLAQYKALKHVLAEVKRISEDGYTFLNSIDKDVESYYRENSI